MTLSPKDQALVAQIIEAARPTSEAKPIADRDGSSFYECCGEMWVTRLQMLEPQQCPTCSRLAWPFAVLAEPDATKADEQCRAMLSPPTVGVEEVADMIFDSVEPILAEICEPTREDYIPAAQAILSKLQGGEGNQVVSSSSASLPASPVGLTEGPHSAGWVLVPREPTQNMIDWGTTANSYDGPLPLLPEPDHDYDADLRRCYRAMVGSAPTPPAESPPLGLEAVTSFPPSEQNDVTALASHTSASQPRAPQEDVAGARDEPPSPQQALPSGGREP
jgi:hypothetical protein